MGGDVDQLSDKHKISLFDDSRFEDMNTLTGGGGIGGGMSLEIG